MPSIISGKYAADLLELFKVNSPVRVQGTGRYSGIEVCARHCTRGSQKSGGAVVVTTIAHPLAPSGRWTRVCNLKKGWTDDNFRNAVHRGTDAALLEVRRLGYVANAEQAAKPHLENPAFLDAVQLEEIRRGKPSDYESMTVEEAESWIEWISNWVSTQQPLASTGS